GWHDDGKVLSAPNGHKVVKGFRQHILDKGWDPGNLPLGEEFPLSQLEDSNPALGGGTQQIFRWTVLEWTQKDNTVREMWTGQELMKVREEKNALAQQVQSLQAQLSALQGQIKQHP